MLSRHSIEANIHIDGPPVSIVPEPAQSMAPSARAGNECRQAWRPVHAERRVALVVASVTGTSGLFGKKAVADIDASGQEGFWAYHR
jgi:hypothetical protein